MRDSYPPLRRRRFRRRTLLGSSGSAAVGAAGLALIGCGDDNSDDADDLRTQLDEANALRSATHLQHIVIRA